MLDFGMRFHISESDSSSLSSGVAVGRRLLTPDMLKMYKKFEKSFVAGRM